LQQVYYNEITLKVWEFETHEQAVSLLNEEQGRYRPNDLRRSVMFAISNFYVIAKPISWNERKYEAIALIESVKEQVGYVKETPEPTPDTSIIPIINIDEECKTYVNEEYNFKFSYPDWKFLEIKEGKKGLLVSVTEKYSVGASMHMKLNPDYSDEELLNRLAESFYGRYGGYEKVERETNINGIPAIELMATNDKECFRYIFIVRDSYAYMISCYQIKDLNSDEQANELCSIVRTTFHFLDIPEPSTPTPEPEQCVKYYNYEGEQIYADMFEDGQKIRMRFENGTSVFWIFESGFFATFDCSEMSAMHERQFENLGYNAKIRCSKFNLFKPRHCWVVLENENGSWTVFEATKQKIIKDDCKIKANYSSWGRESETIEDALGPFNIYYISFNWWDHFDEYKDINWCPIEASTPTSEEGAPGFETIFAIAGLLAVAYLLRRRGEAEKI
jgi:PGF-CTERM protein